MNVKDIIDIYDKAVLNLYIGKISGAFLFAKKLIKELNEWHLQEELDNYTSIYYNMLSFRIQSRQEELDEESRKIYNQMVVGTFLLLTKTKWILLRQHTNLIEAEGEKYALENPQGFTNNFVESIEKLPELLENLKQKEQEETEISEFESRIQEYQSINSALFSIILMKPTLSESEFAMVEKIIQNEGISLESRCVAVAAMTLNALRTFDKPKVNLLLHLCQSDELAIRQRAMVGFALLLSKFGRVMDFEDSIQDRILELKQDEDFVKDLQSIVFQIVRTTETQEVTKHINEDIMPELQKMSPKIKEKLDEIDDVDDDEKIMPKIDSLIDEMNVSDKLHAFADLQMSGSDVYASTFSQMKKFPFFNFLENWVMPFSETNPYLAKFGGERGKLLSIIDSNPMLCNSDKYSFIMNLMMAPEGQLDAIQHAIGEEKEQITDMIKEKTNSEQFSEKSIMSNHYILDLYRFFAFSQRGREFDNPLFRILSLINSETFHKVFSEKEQKIAIAGYYYQYNLYFPAIHLYKQLVSAVADEYSVEVYRNLAYSFQQVSDFQNAIRYYILAEALDKKSMWYQRRLAFCYRKVGDFDKAIQCYQTVLESNEEDFRVMFRLANCFMDKGDYNQALEWLYKIDYLKPDYPRLKSVMLQALWLSDKSERAKELVEKSPEYWETLADLSTIGHVYLSLRHKQQAIEYYRRAISKSKMLGEYLSIVYRDLDISTLQKNGVTRSELDLLLEFVLIDNFR